ncbi:hypothetical protein SOVF_033730 [Spinacia oleracea]|nr:hypothetical protein SOVF_033730 [Spinacia oleracea]
MAGGVRRSMINGGSGSQGSTTSLGRPIPKRGQIKGRIVMGLAHSVVAIFSHATPSHRRR